MVEAAGGATNPDTRHVIRRDRTTGDAIVVTASADGPSYTPAVADNGRVAFTSRADLTSVWPASDHEQVYEWQPDSRRLVQLSADDELGAQADADSRTPAMSGNGAVVAFAAPATTLARMATGGITQVFAHTWVGAACITVLASAADTAASQPPPTDTDDDENRCEDRNTQRLLDDAQTVHNALRHVQERDRRTTAAVRARNHEGDCVVVFAAGAKKNLYPDQRTAARRLGGRIAEPRAGVHAEVTALKHIQRRVWDPLALGIAPETRVICEKLDDDASEEQQTAGPCTAFVEDSGGRILESRREAVWP